MPTNKNRVADLFGNCSCFEEKRHSCIEVPVILDQLQMRKCVTRNIALVPKPGNDHPSFNFIKAENFKIIDLQVLNTIPVESHPDEKEVHLSVGICYDLIYTDGINELVQPDKACFELWIDKIKCHDCSSKIFQKDNTGNYSPVNRIEKTHFSAEALAQTFGKIICSNTGALIIDLGTFFIISSMCLMQFWVPSVVGCALYSELQHFHLRCGEGNFNFHEPVE